MRCHSQGTLWQSLAWKRYQEALGREVRVYAHNDEDDQCAATALVVIDRTIGGYATWEIPRGPLVSEKWRVESGKCEQFLHSIIEAAKKEKCLSLYLSPISELSHFPLSTRHVHPQATRVLDLQKPEQEILAQMHPKGRYNISLAKKHDIVVETCGAHVSRERNIDAFYALLKGTGGRDGFQISQKSHYARFLKNLEGSFLLLAKYDNRPIAGLMGVIWPPPLTPPPRGEGNRERTGMYYYGASSYEHRSLMAPYLLQWEAIRYAKAHGCTRYDLLGISPEHAGSEDPWRGITDFKRKFGGTVVNYPPEQMVVLRPMVKRVLEWKRKLVG